MNIVVELAPYRERRRTRRLAASILAGYLAGDLLGRYLTVLLERVLPDEPDVETL
jgi:hypothetical protein